MGEKMKYILSVIALLGLVACSADIQDYDLVIVNGVFVKRDNAATGKLPGLPIRYPVESEGRHEPASTWQWLE